MSHSTSNRLGQRSLAACRCRPVMAGICIKCEHRSALSELLRSSSAKAIFERYGFSYLVKPTS
jgi:hypothetical protein